MTQFGYNPDIGELKRRNDMEPPVVLIAPSLLSTIFGYLPLAVIPLTYIQSTIVYRSLIDLRNIYFGPALINISFIFIVGRFLYAYAQGRLVIYGSDPRSVQLTVGIVFWLTMLGAISELRHRYPSPPPCHCAQAGLCNLIGLIGYTTFRVMLTSS
jgi:hypothetical protein